MAVQQPLNRKAAARRYTELNHIIAIGAYTKDDEGELWLGDQNLSEEIDDLEAHAASEDLKFVATMIDKTGRRIYQLEELTDNEKKERAAGIDALRHAGIMAQFIWQDQNKIVLNQSGYVMGKVPGETPAAYVVRIDADIRENDPMMTYSWPDQVTLVVTLNAETGEPVIDDATDEQIKQIRAEEEAHSDAAGVIREWAYGFSAISTMPEEASRVRVDLLRLERKTGEDRDLWEALLAIAGGRFNERVVFWLDDTYLLAENRLHIESQQREYPEE